MRDDEPTSLEADRVLKEILIDSERYGHITTVAVAVVPKIGIVYATSDGMNYPSTGNN